MLLHRQLGCVLAVFYIAGFSGELLWFRGIHTAASSVDPSMAYADKADAGIGYIYLLASLSVYFLVFPTSAKHRFSPR